MYFKINPLIYNLINYGIEIMYFYYMPNHHKWQFCTRNHVYREFALLIITNSLNIQNNLDMAKNIHQSLYFVITKFYCNTPQLLLPFISNLLYLICLAVVTQCAPVNYPPFIYNTTQLPIVSDSPCSCNTMCSSSSFLSHRSALSLITLVYFSQDSDTCTSHQSVVYLTCCIEAM